MQYKKNELIQYARLAAQKYGIDPELFVRQINMESGFNPNAKSKAGAIGIAQFMPATAKGMGFIPGRNPVRDLNMAAKLMAGHLRNNGGRYDLALAAYNAGQGNVNKYGGVPPFPETQNYVKNIMGLKKLSTNTNTNNKQPLQGKVSSSDYTGNSKIQRMTMVDTPDLTKYGDQELRQRATQQRTPFDVALDQFRNGLIDYNQIATQFPNEVRDFGITPEMQGRYLPVDVEENRQKLIQMLPQTPDVDKANQRVTEQNKQLIDMSNEREQALNQFMKEQYAAQRADIANNPALRRGNYYVNPDDAEMAIRANTAMGIINRDPSLMGSAADIARARYEAEIANQYGMPYDQLVKAQDDIYKNTVEAAKQNMQNAIIMYQRGQMTTSDLLKALQTNQNAVNTMQNNAAELYQKYATAVDPHIIDAYAQGQRNTQDVGKDITTTGMKQSGGIYRTDQNNAVDMARNAYSIESDLNAQEAANAIHLRGQDQNYDIQRAYVEQGDRRLQEQARQFDEMAPYRQFQYGGQGAMYYSTVPNANAMGIGQGMGAIPQGDYDLRTVPNTNVNLQPSGLFQNLLPQMNNRRNAIEQDMQ